MKTIITKVRDFFRAVRAKIKGWITAIREFPSR